MTHEPRRDELLDLALGLLEPAEARALEAHAAGCAACRTELASLRQTREVLASLPPIEAPERGAPVVLAEARQAAEAARRPRWAAPRWLWGGTLGLAGAAALAVLVLRFTGPTVPGPLSDDREALLGREAPAAAPPAEAPPSLAKVATAEAPKPAEERRAEPLATAKREKKAVGVGANQGDALGFATAAPATVAPPAAPTAAPPAALSAAPAPRAELADEAKAGPPARRAAGMAAGAAADALAEGTPCRLEQRRRYLRDAAGRVVGRVREGRYPAAGGEVALTVEERFGPDGRLLGATVRAGDQPVTVSDADIAAGRLEPLPGVVLARTAGEALSAAPRCEP
jgi:anti-sigma factor RsiW